MIETEVTHGQDNQTKLVFYGKLFHRIDSMPVSILLSLLFRKERGNGLCSLN